MRGLRGWSLMGRGSRSRGGCGVEGKVGGWLVVLMEVGTGM